MPYPLLPDPDHNPSGEATETDSHGRFSRRAFMLMAASLTSCSAAAPIAGRNSSVKTPNNPNYRTPHLDGSIPRNPDMPFSPDFPSSMGVSFSRVPVSGKYVAMTFDDGPHPQNTPRLLDILRARNVKATFYVIGRSVDLYPQVVRRTVAEGHEMGNHSHTHRLMSRLSDSEIRSEMERCRDAVRRAAGVNMRTMRPPYGGLQQRQRELILAEYGYPTILWAVDPLDWKRPGPSVVTSRILESTNPGAIILAHDLHSQTVDAMPATIDGLLRRGYKFVTVSQLLAMRADTATAQASASATGSNTF